MLHPDQCPADPQETSEAYLLHHLAPDKARVFEDHYMTCARCAGIVEETAAFVTAMWDGYGGAAGSPDRNADVNQG